MQIESHVEPLALDDKPDQLYAQILYMRVMCLYYYDNCTFYKTETSNKNNTTSFCRKTYVVGYSIHVIQCPIINCCW